MAIPNYQVMVKEIKISAADIQYSIESGLVAVDTIEERLYSESNAILTITIDAPPLEGGEQIEAWNAIVDRENLPVAFLFPGGKLWSTEDGNVMSASGGQSAGAGSTQNVVIEVPLNTKPR